MSIDPDLWGPDLWRAMHWVAAGYPAAPSEIEKEHYRTFFTNLKHILPCYECREHFGELLDRNSIDPFLISGKQLRQWVCSIHNKVNDNTGSAEIPWSLSKVDSVYIPADESDSTAPLVEPPEEPLEQPLAEPPEQFKKEVKELPHTKSAIYVHPKIVEIKAQQKIVNNTMRSLGKVGSSIMQHNVIISSAPRTKVAPRTMTSRIIPQVTIPKKKGCGCKNKRK